MTKLEVQQRVIKNGKPLGLELFNWDEISNTLYTTENNLCLAFNDIDDCTFTTGSGCAFDTSSGCTFTTGCNCTFTTGYNCTFTAGSDCNFTTHSDCTFMTSSGCTFTTGSRCTFMTGSSCTFTTGYECVIVRRDIFEVIHTDETETIVLNHYNIKGFISK